MGMTRRVLLASSAATVLLGAAGAAVAQAKRPNIVVILADDVGYSDFSSYGGEIPTPNIDALGANGLKFTQFYNCARCSPSRASLLTGAWPHQAGLGHLEQFSIPTSAGIRGALMFHLGRFKRSANGRQFVFTLAHLFRQSPSWAGCSSHIRQSLHAETRGCCKRRSPFPPSCPSTAPG